MKHPTLQTLQAQSVLAMVRDLESFNESRNARDVNVRDVSHIDDGLRRLPSQYGQKLITEGRRGVNAKASPQTQERRRIALG